MMLSSGKLRGEKILYKDGVGCCIWKIFAGYGEEFEDCGICVDFSYAHVPQIIDFVKKSIRENYENLTDNVITSFSDVYFQGIVIPFLNDDFPDMLVILEQMKNVDAEVYDYEEDSE